MNSARHRIFPGFLWIPLLIVIGGLIWANWSYARANPLNSAFLTQWASIRGLITGGVSPYDPSAWQIAQLMAPGQASEEAYIFSQPFYIIFALAPVALIPDLTLARSIWMLVLELCLAGSIVLMLNLRQWEAGRISFFLQVSFVFLGLHSIQALAAGSTAVVAGFFFLFAIESLRKGWDEMAGFGLVLATIQPEATLPAVIFTLVWGLSTGRRRLLVWFVGSLFLLSLIAMFLLPGWLGEYARTLINYWSDIPGVTITDLLKLSLPGIGLQLTWGLRITVVGLLIVEWFGAMKKDFDWFLWTAGLTLTLTPWLGLSTNLENLVLLIFPVFLFQSIWDERTGHRNHWLPISMMVLYWLGLWGLAIYQISRGVSLSPGFLLPLPILVLIGLYWVRWLYIRPLRLYQDPLRKHETLR